MSSQTSPNTPLGLPGFTFADLHQPARLRELYERFVDDVKPHEPELWAQWDAVSRSPGLARRGRARQPDRRDGAARQPVRQRGCSASAPRPRRWRRRRAPTTILFRFKIDFVRRRALPLLKAGAHVEATADDHALVESITSGAATARRRPRALARVMTREMRAARSRRGCALLDRKPTDKAAVAAEIESLKRWCAAHVHDPRYRGWVVFRFPENLDYDHLVHVAAARSGAARGDGRSRREAAPPRRLQAHRPALHARARS